MTNKYASEDLYTSFNIREPQERSDLYHKHGLTDNITQSMTAYHCSNNDSWGQETGTILFDSVTGKYFRANQFVDSSNTSRWFTLDQLSQTTNARLSPSNTSVEVYSDNCILLRTFSYIDPTDNVTKYLIAGSNLHWRTVSEMNSTGFFFEEAYAPLYLRSTGTTYVTLESVGTVSGSFEFSYDGLNFSSYTLGTEKQVNDGERIFFRGTRSTVQNSNNYLHFTITGTGTVAAYGNVNSLVYKNNYVNTTFTQQNYSYYKLFSNCSKLTRAPLLPYTKLSTSCYESMFENCTSLAEATQLPATTLVDSCYFGMFSGCTSLTRSPDLPAVTPAASCYNNMFNGCSSLNEIHCKLNYDNSVSVHLTENWIYNVAANGDFYCDTLDGWPTNSEDFYMGVPIGWVVHVEQPLCFKNINTGNSTVILKNTVTSSGTALTTDYEYSKSSDYEGAVWLPYTIGEQITLQQNESVYFRGSRSTQSSNSYMQFELSGKLNASGNTYSLLDKINFSNISSLTSYGTCAFYKLFENCQSLYKCPDLPATTLELNCYYKAFYGCTNIEKIPSLLSTAIPADAYGFMFYGCTSIDYLDAYTLPATIVQPWGCEYMFCNCTNLMTSPKLAGLTLYGYAYASMFRGCTNLRYMPKLPATTLGNYCYSYMFCNCTSLIAEPELPAAELVSSCYAYMFYNCHNISKILCKAKSIANGATNCTTDWLYGTASSGEFYYYNEDIWTKYSTNGIPDGWSDYLAKPLCFENTDSNEAVIKLNQIGSSISPVYSISRDDNTWESYTIGTNIQLNSTLGNKVYFKGSKDIGTSSSYIRFVTSTSASTAINASGNVNSILSDNMYTYSKILDLTPYGNYCLYNLFKDCHITSAPSLPAMTLTPYCYCGMFSGCKKLTRGPILPAKVLAGNCYRNMYMNCESLNEIHCDATDNILPNASVMWNQYNNLASTGKLYVADLNIWPTESSNATPAGWGVYVEQPLCFENSDERNHGTIALNNTVSSSGTALSNLSYEYAVTSIANSYRKLKWLPYTFTGTDGYSIPFEPETKIYFRGSRSTQSSSSYLQFNINLPDAAARGNINSLLSTDFKDITSLSLYGSHTFYKLFFNGLALTSAPSLPAKSITTYSYGYTFYHCEDLYECPKLPATTVGFASNYYMFSGCKEITYMPNLPATTLNDYCYSGMFYNCESLTTITELPAMTLAPYCYSYMFSGCISLTKSPDLPAAELNKESCYSYMFSGCTSLNEVTCYAESITGANSTSGWLANVASSGVFNCINNSIWTVDSSSGIPVGWTVNVMDTQPLCIRFKSDSSSDTMTVSLNAVGTFSSYNLETSRDNINWSSYTPGTQLTAAKEEPLYFRGTRGTVTNPENNYLQFSIDAGTKPVYVSGNVSSLLNQSPAIYSKDLDLENYGSYVFKNLFKDCTSVYSITESYNSQFSNFKLPTRLSTGCFYGMFDGCIGLYYSEYVNTSKLLSSTTLKQNCYNSMFKDCIRVNRLYLPATTPVTGCYDNMFNGCTSLDTLYCDINTVTSVNNFTFSSVTFTDWLSNVSSSGKLYCTHPIIYTRDSASGIPNGWDPYCIISQPILIGANDHSARSEYWWMTDCLSEEVSQETFKSYEPSHHSHLLETIATSSTTVEANGDYGGYIPYVKLAIDSEQLSSEDTEIDIRAYIDNNLPAMEVFIPYEQYRDPSIPTIIGAYGDETGLMNTMSGLPDNEYSLTYYGNYAKIAWTNNSIFNGLYCCISKEYDGYLGWDMSDYATIRSSSTNDTYELYNTYMNNVEIPKQNAELSSTFRITALYDEYGNLIPLSKYNGTLVIRVDGSVISLFTARARTEDLNVYKVSFVRVN